MTHPLTTLIPVRRVEERRVEPEERAQLEEVMRRAAGGDRAASFVLAQDFGAQIAAAVRRAAQDLGAGLDPDDVASLTVEAALELARLAGGWRPDGGALPWVWARARIRNLVVAHVGHRTVSLDAMADGGAAVLDQAGPEASPLASHHDDREPRGVLADLAAVDDDVRRVAEALGRESDRNQDVFLAYRLHRAEGSEAPSEATADAFGLTPANVRQIASRVSRRLRDSGIDLSEQAS